MLKIKEVEEQRAEYQAQMKAIWEQVESREVKNLTEDETAKIDELDELIKSASATIAKLKETEKSLEEQEPEETADPKEKETVAKERRQFENFIRKVKNEETASDNNMTFDTNGAVIPTTIADKIIKQVYDISPILEKSTKYNVKGKLEIPYYKETEDENIKMAYQDEFEELTSNSGKFTSIELEGFLAGALAKISKKLINNSKFNIVDFVITQMSEAVALFIEKELLIGTENKVEGLSGITNIKTTNSSSALTTDELIDAKDSIKQASQKSALWIMHTDTLTSLRKLKYTDGKYILNEDLTSEFGYKLLGKDVYVSDNMPRIGAGSKAIYYGDMKGLATKFTEEMNIEVLREKFATQHAVGVVAWIDFDSKVENAQALVAIQMKESA